ncbi:sigma-70 family RNA polymerase sigma factor [Pinirhizobacter sp.]|jgi:RNA polymerase sigma factor for flagellar operon FliA|uniref:sigma-70 family RNA polymerase sigma factor n=1 Tax=Pinirhizobacter sp. TaxID=2950432 RepID=UPI002F42D697
MLDTPTPTITDDDRPALWQRWRGERDALARDALAMRYAPWARRIARDVFMRCRGRSSDWPDYVQNASIGLLEALANFDDRRGVPFEAFARLRVRGAVFNGLRDLNGGHGQRAPATEERVDSLLDGDSSDPVDAFIAAVSGLATGHLLGSLAELEAPQALPTPYEEAVRSQVAETLAIHMERLPAREREILTLHYLHFLPFNQVAHAMEVTPSRISQLHRQGLARLRSFMLERHLERDF